MKNANVSLMTTAAVMWGTHGIFVALSDASMGTAMLWRTGLVIIGMSLVIAIGGRIGRLLKQSLSAKTCLSGLALALNAAMFVAAIAAGGDIGAIVALVYAYPVWTVAIRAIRRKPISRADLSSVLWGLAGVGLIVANGWGTAPVLPLTYALISGFGLALHLEVNEEADTREETEQSLLVASSIGFTLVAALGGLGAIEVRLPESQTQLFWLAVLGTATAATYALYAYAGHVRNSEGKRLSSVTTGQILLLEIIVAAALDWVVLGSPVTLYKLIGGAFVLRALWIQITSAEQ